jgi:hypothetical protein
MEIKMKQNNLYIVLWCLMFCISSHRAYGIENPFAFIYKKIKTCGKIIPLAGKVSLKKAEYIAKKSFLSLADKLEVLDPRLTSLAVEERAAQAALTAAQGALRLAENGLLIAKKGAQATSELSKAVSVFSGKAFNIKKAYFEGYAIDFSKSPKVRLMLDGVVAGKPITIKDVEFNLLVPAESIKNILEKALVKLTAGL